MTSCAECHTHSGFYPSHPMSFCYSLFQRRMDLSTSELRSYHAFGEVIHGLIKVGRLWTRNVPARLECLLAHPKQRLGMASRRGCWWLAVRAVRAVKLLEGVASLPFCGTYSPLLHRLGHFHQSPTPPKYLTKGVPAAAALNVLGFPSTTFLTLITYIAATRRLLYSEPVL